MKSTQANPAGSTAPHEAARFWERGRILYNAILITIVLLWLVFTWPHFRPSLTLGSLEAFVVLAFLANLCYSATYLAEIVIQLLAPGPSRRRARIALLALGTLLAIVLENYWIADEIYPAANNPPPIIGGMTNAGPAALASNMNFPAPLAVVGFLAACGILFCGAAATFIFWFARKPKFARTTGLVVAAACLLYSALLLAFSASSHATTLARGQEKYFCEIDCHLAYSVVDVKAQRETGSSRYLITLRTRFDQTTTSPTRPRDVPLTPSPREVRLVDSFGREYPPVSTRGTPLLTPLKPSESYTSALEFTTPKDATGVKLLISTTPAWPNHVVIGDENSFLHKKTYLSL